MVAFRRSRAGAAIDFDLEYLGSNEALRRLAGGDACHLFLPASSQQSRVLTAQAGEELPSLVQSPMVYLFWEDRHRTFVNKFGQVDSASLRQALAAADWQMLGGPAEWGYFKFAFADPASSNSGAAAWLLLCRDFSGGQAWTPERLQDPDSQAFLAGMKRGLQSGARSSDAMLRDMLLKGPSTYDALCVYENLALQACEAPNRWGKLIIVRPEPSPVADHPALLLRQAGTAQRQVARAFLGFLLSPSAQEQAVRLGFRRPEATLPAFPPAEAAEARLLEEAWQQR
jgi:hypothetical protein